jgi:hypothetical protein
MRCLQVLSIAALAIACGSDDDFSAPTCAEGEVVIEGTIDGGNESASLSGWTSYIFVNAIGDDLGTLTVSFAADEMLYLEWPELVANGDSTGARGTVALAGLDYGNCEDDGFPGALRMDDDGDGGAFQLPRLHASADCSAPELDGELVGCFRSMPF